MAKVKGPLFSLTAFGTVGNLLTYRRTPGKVAAYVKPVPTDRESGCQLMQRASFASAVSAWGALPGASKAWWNMYAAGMRISGYISFMKSALLGACTPGGGEPEGYGCEAYPYVDTIGPVGGGSGYVDIITAVDYEVTTYAEILAALADADGTPFHKYIYVPEGVEIDCVARRDLLIKPGVVLYSRRGLGSNVGGVIKITTLVADSTYPMFLFVSTGCRVTGLQIKGPDDNLWVATGNTHEIWLGLRCYGAGIEVDNCEISGWPYGAIAFTGDYTIDGYVHHSYIHHNARMGFGYGVQVDNCTALIEACIMDYNRHCITGERDYPVSNYRALYCDFGAHNLVAQCVDMHGGNDISAPSVPAGGSIEVGWCTFRTVTGYPTWVPTPVSIRGVPLIGADFHNNDFLYHADLQTFLIYQACDNIGGVDPPPEVPWQNITENDNRIAAA